MMKKKFLLVFVVILLVLALNVSSVIKTIDGVEMDCKDNPDNPEYECCEPVDSSDDDASDEVDDAADQTPDKCTSIDDSTSAVCLLGSFGGSAVDLTECGYDNGICRHIGNGKCTLECQDEEQCPYTSGWEKCLYCTTEGPHRYCDDGCVDGADEWENNDDNKCCKGSSPSVCYVEEEEPEPDAPQVCQVGELNMDNPCTKDGQPGHYICINRNGVIRWGTECRLDKFNCQKVGTQPTEIWEWKDGKCLWQRGDCQGVCTKQTCLKRWGSCNVEGTADYCYVEKSGVGSEVECDKNYVAPVQEYEKCGSITFNPLEGVSAELADLVGSCTVSAEGQSATGCNSVTLNNLPIGKHFSIKLDATGKEGGGFTRYSASIILDVSYCPGGVT